MYIYDNPLGDINIYISVAKPTDTRLSRAVSVNSVMKNTTQDVRYECGAVDLLSPGYL